MARNMCITFLGCHTDRFMRTRCFTLCIYAHKTGQDKPVTAYCLMGANRGLWSRGFHWVRGDLLSCSRTQGQETWRRMDTLDTLAIRGIWSHDLSVTGQCRHLLGQTPHLINLISSHLHHMTLQYIIGIINCYPISSYYRMGLLY